MYVNGIDLQKVAVILQEVGLWLRFLLDFAKTMQDSCPLQ